MAFPAVNLIGSPVAYEVVIGTTAIAADVELKNNANIIVNGGSATTVRVDMVGASNVAIPLQAGQALPGQFTRIRRTGSTAARNILIGYAK